MSTMSDALRTIIAKSPMAGSDAIDCLRAISVKSPVVQQRYNNVLGVALSDGDAHFTPQERTLLAEFAGGGEPETRSIMQPVRLSPAERQELEDAAQAAGQSLSDYIRSRLFAR